MSDEQNPGTPPKAGHAIVNTAPDPIATAQSASSAGTLSFSNPPDSGGGPPKSGAAVPASGEEGEEK